MEFFNKYSEDDEYKLYAKNPEMMKFQQKALAKANGQAIFDEFIKTTVLVKNGENFLKSLNPQDSSYESISRMVDEKRRLLEESRQMISEDQSMLEKIANAIDKVATDPFEKALDVVKGFLGNEDVDEQETSPTHQGKPLKMIFGK